MHMICFHKPYDVVGWIWSEIWHLFHPNKCGVLHMNNFPLQYLKMVLCCVLCANRVWGDHFAMFLHDLFPPNLLFYYYFQFIFIFLQSWYISPRKLTLKHRFYVTCNSFVNPPHLQSCTSFCLLGRSTKVRWRTGRCWRSSRPKTSRYTIWSRYCGVV